MKLGRPTVDPMLRRRSQSMSISPLTWARLEALTETDQSPSRTVEKMINHIFWAASRKIFQDAVKNSPCEDPREISSRMHISTDTFGLLGPAAAAENQDDVLPDFVDILNRRVYMSI